VKEKKKKKKRKKKKIFQNLAKKNNLAHSNLKPCCEQNDLIYLIKRKCGKKCWLNMMGGVMML